MESIFTYGYAAKPNVAKNIDLASTQNTERKEFLAFKSWLEAEVFPELCPQTNVSYKKSNSPFKLLVIPPDYTRKASLSGIITVWLYQWMKQHFNHQGFILHILPALGTHHRMRTHEIAAMFPGLLQAKEVTFLHHHYKKQVQVCGEMSLPLVAELSAGLVSEKVVIELNSALFAPYHAILSLGQVLPHEILGMANYTKNIVIGLGGKAIIDKTHFLAALLGMENLIGKTDNVIRTFIDSVFNRYLVGRQKFRFLHTILVPSTAPPLPTSSPPSQENPVILPALAEGMRILGATYGLQRQVFTEAAALAYQVNFHCLPQAQETVWAEFPAAGYPSTWITNKAIYRLRMIMAPGGELLILAPGVRAFGESPAANALIETYGFHEKSEILEKMQTDPVLRSELAIAIHLIYGCSAGRFKITYAVDPNYMPLAKVKAVGYHAITIEEAMHRKENPAPDAAKTYFVTNPALGCWRLQKNS